MSASADALTFTEHLRVDPSSDAILDALTEALLTPLARAYLAAHGDDTMPPLAALTDPRVAPLWALPHTAVWCGGEIPGRNPDENTEDYTARIRHAVVYPRGMRRGSFEVLRSAVAATLTGTRTVILTERLGGNPYALHVQTYASETPEPSRTAAVARSTPIAAEIVLTIETISGQTYTQVESKHADYDAVRVAYPDYAAMRADM